MLNEADKKRVLDAIQMINDLVELGDEGLARSKEVSALRTGLSTLLDELVDLDSVPGRKYDRWNRQTRWHEVSRDGFAMPSEIDELREYKPFLIELLGEEQPNDNFQVIKKNRLFDGRMAIRRYLEQAKSNIDIHDNYIGREIIDIIQPYAENGNIQIRVTTKVSKLKTYQKSDLLAFLQQYSNVSIRNSDDSHARFFIIDSDKVIKSGASLKDLGKDLDTISEVTEKSAKEDLINNFEEWWSNGDDLA
jgi:hypothetical protein